MKVDQDEVLRRITMIDPVPLLDHDAPHRPEAIALREQIVLSQPKTAERHRGRTRRKPAVVASGVIGVLIVGGVAAASGPVPDGVTRRFAMVTPRGDAVTDVQMVVEHVSANGVGDQVWLGHDKEGQLCQDVRTVSPEGFGEDGAVGCGLVIPGPASPAKDVRVGTEPAGRPWPSLTYDVIARTTLAAAARMSLVFPGGRRYGVSYNRRTGWAIGVVPPDVTALRGVLVVRDKHGRVIRKEPIPATRRR